jgi:hypothetical protein
LGTRKGNSFTGGLRAEPFTAFDRKGGKKIRKDCEKKGALKICG